MGKLVRYEFDNGLAVVTLDNPPVNSLTVDMSNELRTVFEELRDFGTEDTGDEKKQVQAVILNAVSKKNVFVAGADINLFLNLKTREDGLNLLQFYHGVFNAIAEFPSPVICAIEGLALGGGTELALACDIRIAGAKATFALTEVTLGVLPGGGGTQRLSRLVGAGYAKKMIFSGQQIDAEEALRIGLVEQVVPQGQALLEARKLAHTILQNAPTAIRCAKKAIDGGLDATLANGLLLEQEAMGRICESGEPIEGGKAFLEKRKPKFG
ncbi:MAG: enoyl-CoA hydratase-related protein [Desulfomonilaceae bacterium]|nr:enoyl-CoA hydratase-related protein [Desulfomonilaceae bacterium]